MWILGIIVVIWWWIASIYNRLISLKNKRGNAEADIDVQLKLRFDLVDNLVNTVKGYADHEKSTFEEITKARTQFMNAQNIEDKAWASNMLTWALKSLFAVAENYPELKANENFLQLQNELSDIENKIAAARRFFNNATREFNTYLESFPSNVVGKWFGFKQFAFFEIDDEAERERPDVQFEQQEQQEQQQ